MLGTSQCDANLLIGGEWCGGQERLEVRNPARPKEVVGTIVRARACEVDAAVAAAQSAQSSWAKKTFSTRAAILSRSLDRLEEGLEERARLYVRENGKTLKEARAELAGVASRQKIAFIYADELDAGRELDSSTARSRVLYRPYGVVVSIVPWNSPITLAFSQIIAALLAGNTVVLKPPETCPLALTKTIEIFARELPSGVLNLVTGLPSEIGDALTSHPGVGKIGFTGSIAAARHIMGNAALTIKGVTLELGGNDPALVLADADLGERPLRALASATFRMAGQVCMAVKRIYVPRSIEAHFTQAFTRAAEAVVVGDGLQPSVSMGPLHTRRALERANALVLEAKQDGANVISCGRIDERSQLYEGHFMRPTVVTNIVDGNPLVSEEQFCPVVPILVYDDLDEAIERINDTVYGLSASIWSRDADRGALLAPRVAAGQIWINQHGPQATNHLAPYGGVKQSGLGRKSGLEGILEYLQTQTVTIWN